MASDVAHYEGLTHWSPIRAARVESILDRLALGAGHHALDLACGRAELLIRLVERFGVAATGVDRSAAAIAIAEAELARRAPAATVSLVVGDATRFAPSSSEHDVVSWLGGPYLDGGFASTLRRLASWTRPGGHVIVGHGFWASEPPSAYLDATGIPRDELASHDANVALVEAAGLTVVDASISDREEWDHFEGRILANWERHLGAHPEDAELRATVEKKRAWDAAQRRWGRAAMGFGLYLSRR
ncbi:MAG: cyclopropane-fatty-acyl-phospholipid synthase family protein [Sandaracinaceae bacterium]